MEFLYLLMIILGGSLLGFSLVAFLVYCIMNSLGELATHMPVSGSFTTYAGILVDPALSFALGWNYWLQWSVSFPSELSAAGIIMAYWTPTIPSVVWSAIILFLLLFVHFLGVKGFGETEYWLSLIKVIAILCFIAAGMMVDLGLIGYGSSQKSILSSSSFEIVNSSSITSTIPLMCQNTQFYLQNSINHTPLLSFYTTPPVAALNNSSWIGFNNWRIDGAPFKNGIVGVFKVFLMAFFAFGGTELIGVAAGEAQAPKETIPKAIRQTFWRIWFFYILSIFVMGLVIRNDDPSLLLASKSGNVAIAPFTLVFERAGLSFAAHLMNGVVFSAVLSAGNSALYAASRTLMSLSLENRAPAIFSKLSSRGVPIYSILITGLFGCLSFLAIFWEDGALFVILVHVTGVSGILTWLSISIIHIRFRNAFILQGRDIKNELSFLAPFYPFGQYVAIFLGLCIIVGQAWAAYLESTYLVLVTFAGIPLFLGLFFSYKFANGSEIVNLKEVNLDALARMGSFSEDLEHQEFHSLEESDLQ